MMITLTQLRLEADLSIEGLAEKSGVSSSTISRLERGQVSPSFLTAHRISKALGRLPHEIQFGGRQ